MNGISASPETNCTASSGRGWIVAGVIGFAVVAGVVSDKAFSQTPEPNVQVFATNAREGGNDGNFVFNITDALSFDARIQFDLTGTADSSDYTLNEGGGVTVGSLMFSGNGGEFTVAAGTVQVVLNLVAADDDDDDETLSLTVTGLAFDTDRNGSFADDSDPAGRNAATATLIDATSPPLPPRFSLSAPTRAVVSEATPTETSMVTFTLHNLTLGDGSTNNTVFLELNGRNPDSNTAFAEWGIDYSLEVTHSGSTPAPITGIPLITFFPSFELPNNIDTAEITVTPIAGDGHEAVPEIILIKVTEVHLRPRQTALENNFPNCSPGGNATDPTVCTSVGARQTIAVTDAEDAPAGTERAVLTFDTGRRTRSGPQSDTLGEPGNIFLNDDRAHRFVRDGADAGDPSIDESVGEIFSLHLSNLGGRNEQVARFRYNLIDVSENPVGLFVVGSALTINRSARLPPGRWDDEQAIRTASLRNIAAISDSTLTFPSFEFEHNDITSTFGPQSFIFEVYQVDFGIGTVGTGDRGNSSFTSNGDSVITDEPYRLRVTVIDNDNQTYATAIESVQVSRSGLREGEGIVVRVTLNGRAGGVENIIPYTLAGTGIEAADIDDDNADGDGNPLTGGIAVPFYRDYGETVITAAADGLFEGDERMTIRTTGSNSIALNAVAANNAATVALMDGDRLPVPTELVEFSIPDGSSLIAEGSSVVVTATLDHPVPQGDPAISIPYTLTGADVTADDFSNHAELRGAITIATGAIKGTAIITSADNALAESDKTVTVALGPLPNNSAGAQLTTSLDNITFVITGDEASTVPVVTLTRAPPTVTEGATGQFMLNLGTVPGGVATVTYTLVITGPNASANDIIVIPSIDGELVVNGTGDMATINLNIGTPSRLTIAVLANRDNDPTDELVTLTISRIEIADIILGPDDIRCDDCDPAVPGALSITVLDNDTPTVTLTRNRASVTEGAGTAATFTLALRNMPEPNGRSTITSTITISGDDAHESDIVPVSSGQVNSVALFYAGSTSRRTAPIAPTGVDFFTLDINNHAADYTLNISPHPHGDDDTTNEIVTYAITEILLPGLGDFDLSNIVCGDCDPPGSSSLSITVIDDDAPSARLTWSESELSINERRTAEFILNLDNAPNGPATITYTLIITGDHIGNDAIFTFEGEDDEANPIAAVISDTPITHSIDIDGGQEHVELLFESNQDDDLDNEVVTFTITSIEFVDGTRLESGDIQGDDVSDGGLSIEIIDTTSPPVVTLTRNSPPIANEDSSMSPAVGAFTLNLDNIPSGSVTITYTLQITGDNVGNDANANFNDGGSNINAVIGDTTNTLSVSTSFNTKTVRLFINPNDDADSSNEFVIFTIRRIELAVGITLGPDVIRCSDCSPSGVLSITIVDASVPRTVGFLFPITISETDTRTAAEITFGFRDLPPNHGGGTFPVSIPQRDADNPSLSTILDYRYEHQVGSLPAVFPRPPAVPDFDVTIPSAHQSTGIIVFRFNAINDNYDEAEEEIVVHFSDITFQNLSMPITPSTTTVTIRIVDDDDVSAELNKSDRDPVEGVSAPSTFTVTITEAPDADAEVTYTLEGGVGTKYNAIADGTNNAGILNANGTFTIPRNNITGTNTGLQGGAQGAAEVVINITPQNDADSDNEDVTLTIHSITFANGSDHGNLSAGDIGGTDTINGAQILTIMDNTEPSATPAADYASTADITITEGEGGAGSTLTLTNAPGTANVAFTFSGGTASAGAESDINFSVSGGGDLTFNADGTTGTFTIPMGTAAAVLTFTANTDSDSNSERITFTVTGITFDNGAFVSELPDPLTITISDPTLSVMTVTVSNPTIAVGEMTTVTFALSNFPVLVRGIDVVRTEFSFGGFPPQGSFNPPSNSGGATTTASTDYDLAFSGDFSNWGIRGAPSGALVLNVPVSALRDDAAANVVMTVTAKAASMLTATHSQTRSFGSGDNSLRTHQYAQVPSLQFTITEALVPPTARFSATDADASELNNDPAVATLTLMNADAAGGATVSFELSSDDAIFGVRSGDGFDPANADYLLAAIFPDTSGVSLTDNPGTVDLPARFREVRFRITPIADALSEGPEEVEIVVTNVTFSNADVPAITTRSTATMTIADYGTLPTARLSLDGNSEINEGGSTSVFTLRLDDAPNGTDIAVVAYSLTVTGGNDPANDDITAEFGLAAAGNTRVIGGTGRTFTMDVANRTAIATLTIASSADDDDNTDEIVTFTVTGITFPDIVGVGIDIPDAPQRPVPPPLSLDINDDDPTIEIFGFRTGTDGNRREDQDIEISIILSAALPEAGIVRFRVFPADSGDAIDENDVSSALNFGADRDNFLDVPASRLIEFPVDVADDNRVEQDVEHGRINLISITWGTHTIERSAPPLSFTITDNDGITLALDAAEYRVRANAGILTVTVHAVPNPNPDTFDRVILDRNVVSRLIGADGTAMSGNDYMIADGTLTYAENTEVISGTVNSMTVDIQIIDDGSGLEQDFILTLDGGDTGVSLGALDAATVTIIPNVSASYAPGTDTDFTLIEGGASTERTLTLVNAPNAIATVFFEFTGGTVAGGSAPDPSLIFTTGEDPTTPTVNSVGNRAHMSGSFTIPADSDGGVSVPLNFKPATDANGDDEAMTFKITSIIFDNDDIANIEQLSTLNIVITDNGVVRNDVNLAPAPRGASEVNNAPARATLTPIGGTINAGDATVSYELRNGPGVIFGSGTDSDFTPADADYLLDIIIGDNMPTRATTNAGTLILPDADEAVSFRITPIADGVSEVPPEEVTVFVSSITFDNNNQTFNDRFVILTIADYGPLPTAALSLSDNSVSEGGSGGVFSLGLRNAPIGTGIAEVTYNLIVGGDNSESADITAAFGAAASDDATADVGENNTFMMDVDGPVATATLTITPADDADTVNETVTFAVTGVTFIDIGTGTDITGVSSRSLTINDDDPSTATVTISGNVNENENIEVTVTLDKPLPEDGTVRYTIRPRPAASGAGIAEHDVSAVHNFGAGNDNVHAVSASADNLDITFRVDVVDDNRIEPDTEGGIITIARVVWGSHTLVVDADLSFTIADNDGITLTLAAAEHRVRDNAGTLAVTVNAAPNPSPSTDAGVILDRAVTATLAGSGARGDYTVVNPSLNYAINGTARGNIPPEIITVRIRDDDDTADEIFVLDLASGDRAVSFDAPNAATVTIVPNTSAHYNNTAGITITEGGEASESEEERILMLEHAPPTGATITFTFMFTVAGSAEGDSFVFSARNGTFVINPDRMGGNIRIPADTTRVPLVFRAVDGDGNTANEIITFTITRITFDDPGTVTDIAGNNRLRIIIRDADSSASLRLRIRTFLEGALQ